MPASTSAGLVRACETLVCADALFIQGSRQAIGMCARGVRVALPSRAHGDWACSTCQCISIGGTIPAARPFQIPFVPLRSTRPLTQSSLSIDSIGAHRQLATILQHAAAAQLRAAARTTAQGLVNAAVWVVPAWLGWLVAVVVGCIICSIYVFAREVDPTVVARVLVGPSMCVCTNYV
eukprot:scaffold34629_cov135-Isochrysis_galbana.AAC.3